MSKALIYYARVDEFWRREQKYAYLDERQHIGSMEWQELQPDARHAWITEGLEADFDSFLPLGTKEARSAKSTKAEAIFKTYSLGVSTNRDDVVYDFDKNELLKRVEKFCEDYNAEVFRYQQKGKMIDVDTFLKYDQIKWSRNLKRDLKNQKPLIFDSSNIRIGMYRPFTKRYFYLSETIIDELGKNQAFFPITEVKNQVICVGGYGRKAFSVLVNSYIPNLNFYADPAQTFPFYTYDEDGTNRRENITDWALERFRAEYGDESITKWDIFHYVYAVLHHPFYRERYAANLKRELPRVPFAQEFRAFAEAGARLAELHVNYERQPEYPLEKIERTGAKLDWRVEKMRLGKDRTSVVYNDFLTLGRIPVEAFEYRLGNRSALEWVIDQYRVTTDKRSGIVNDPNRHDDPQYIVRLVGQVTTVSLETVRVVRSLPALSVRAEA
jgi:predicted helicase